MAPTRRVAASSEPSPQPSPPAGRGGRKAEPLTGEAALRPVRRNGHDRLASICMALPEVEATSFGEHTRFGVRGKTFLYYLDDHHGDGRIALNVKTGMLAQAELVEAAPARFFRPAYLAHQGWTGLELAGVRDRRRRVDWEEVAALVMDSYLLVAPKRLGALVAR